MRLREWLTVNEVSVIEFGENIGISPQSIHRYLTGERSPRRATLEKILAATGGQVTPNDFFCADRMAA